MSSRLILLVALVACAKKDTAFRAYTVTTEDGGCVVTGLGDAPYAYDCGGGRYHMAGRPNEDPKDPSTMHYAAIGSECFPRPLACHERSCLGEPIDCPPAAAADPIPPSRWAVVRKGDECTLTPAAPTHLTPPDRPFSMVCPPEYGNPVAVIWREGKECSADSGEECPPGARCEPDIHKVPCPPVHRR